jgi:DNA/RNA-binding domain of Phe-tRNA-synthetase-like protein
VWFGYHHDIVEQFPEINAAVLWVDSFVNRSSHSDIDVLLAESEQLIRTRCEDRASISRQAAIHAWRDAYSRMGLKPNRYPCATEQLMRRVVDGQSVPRISALVDLGNAAALRWMVTIAPFDLARIDGYCEVRHADGSERFWPINGDHPDQIPPGEVIFADTTPDVISRRWAWRQSDKGKVTSETSELLFVVEAMHLDGERDTSEAAAFLAAHLRELLGAQVAIDSLNRCLPRGERLG